ncbi:hypothetical protein TNCV_2098551 [Trichonephila clavipes]|nr:hypothetical protein TNCV_2098551 [Trichonephila clavipes]
MSHYSVTRIPNRGQLTRISVLSPPSSNLPHNTNGRTSELRWIKRALSSYGAGFSGTGLELMTCRATEAIISKLHVQMACFGEASSSKLSSENKNISDSQSNGINCLNSCRYSC